MSGASFDHRLVAQTVDRDDLEIRATLELAAQLGHVHIHRPETGLELAQSLHDALESPEKTLVKISRLCGAKERAQVLAHQGEPIYAFIAPHTPTDSPLITVSTDSGDASWCAPTSQISAAAWAADTPAHTWQVVAIGKSSIAHKAMLFAAKVLGIAGAQLMADGDLLCAAQEEFAARTAASPYVCPIPKGIEPKY